MELNSECAVCSSNEPSLTLQRSALCSRCAAVVVPEFIRTASIDPAIKQPSIEFGDALPSPTFVDMTQPQTGPVDAPTHARLAETYFELGHVDLCRADMVKAFVHGDAKVQRGVLAFFDAASAGDHATLSALITRRRSSR